MSQTVFRHLLATLAGACLLLAPAHAADNIDAPLPGDTPAAAEHIKRAAKPGSAKAAGKHGKHAKRSQQAAESKSASGKHGKHSSHAKAHKGKAAKSSVKHSKSRTHQAAGKGKAHSKHHAKSLKKHKK